MMLVSFCGSSESFHFGNQAYSSFKFPIPLTMLFSFLTQSFEIELCSYCLRFFHVEFYRLVQCWSVWVQLELVTGCQQRNVFCPKIILLPLENYMVRLPVRECCGVQLYLATAVCVLISPVSQKMMPLQVLVESHTEKAV